MADAQDLESCAERHGGSSPLSPTKFIEENKYDHIGIT